jgi:hypothetical protein
VAIVNPYGSDKTRIQVRQRDYNDHQCCVADLPTSGFSMMARQRSVSDTKKLIGPGLQTGRYRATFPLRNSIQQTPQLFRFNARNSHLVDLKHKQDVSHRIHRRIYTRGLSCQWQPTNMPILPGYESLFLRGRSALDIYCRAIRWCCYAHLRRSLWP